MIDSFIDLVINKTKYEYKFGINLAEYNINVNCVSLNLHNSFFYAFAHLNTIFNVDKLDLSIFVIDYKTTKIKLPDLSIKNKEVLVGSYYSFDFNNVRMIFRFGLKIFELIDYEKKIAIYWIDDADCLPYWEKSFPFRQILNWFLKDSTFALLHAGCIAINENAFLLPGPSGSGKSTFCLSI